VIALDRDEGTVSESGRDRERTPDNEFGRAFGRPAGVGRGARVAARVAGNHALDNEQARLVANRHRRNAHRRQYRLLVQGPRKRDGLVALRGHAAQLNVIAFRGVLRGEGQRQKRGGLWATITSKSAT